jgi:predicted enzyme related to lactoylglutathione lyase
MDSVVHFELPADDFARAKKFYSETFGWQLMDMPEMNYVLATSTEVDPATKMPKMAGAINGGMMKRDGVFQAPSLAISVKNIEEALEKVKTAGGMILKEKTAVSDMGFIAYFKDTEGNVMSVWQNAAQ